MEWSDVFQFLVTSGILAAIVGVLVKVIIKILGDKLGWDEVKKLKWQHRLEKVAETAIHFAEEQGKHKAFRDPEEQSKFKENLAINFVAKNMGIDDKVAKAAVRAAFSLSGLSKPVGHDKVAKFADVDDPEALIEAQGG